MPGEHARGTVSRQKAERQGWAATKIRKAGTAGRRPRRAGRSADAVREFAFYPGVREPGMVCERQRGGACIQFRKMALATVQEAGRRAGIQASEGERAWVRGATEERERSGKTEEHREGQTWPPSLSTRGMFLEGSATSRCPRLPQRSSDKEPVALRRAGRGALLFTPSGAGDWFTESSRNPS